MSDIFNQMLDELIFKKVKQNAKQALAMAVFDLLRSQDEYAAEFAQAFVEIECYAKPTTRKHGIIVAMEAKFHGASVVFGTDTADPKVNDDLLLRFVLGEGDNVTVIPSQSSKGCTSEVFRQFYYAWRTHTAARAKSNVAEIRNGSSAEQ